MLTLVFDSGNYTVGHQHESITLLPREFALLHHLYHHANQTLSREQLLDAVWANEHPTDRTVDDHIYRLRKKLAGWDTLLSIETVRGQGYRFAICTVQADPFVPDDPSFDKQINELFTKYHQLGLGGAMETLMTNQQSLRIRVPQFYEMYLHFVRGDFIWMIEAKHLDFWEKAFFLLHVYSYIQENTEEVIRLFETAISSRQLPYKWQQELMINRISLYLETGNLVHARELMDAGWEYVRREKLNTFQLIMLQKECIYSLLLRDLTACRDAINQLEQQLVHHPNLMIEGTTLLIKGWHFLAEGDSPKKAREAIQQGIARLQESRFVPHLIHGVRLLLKFIAEPQLDGYHHALWNQLVEQYKLKETKHRLQILFAAHF